MSETRKTKEELFPWRPLLSVYQNLVALVGDALDVGRQLCAGNGPGLVSNRLPRRGADAGRLTGGRTERKRLVNWPFASVNWPHGPGVPEHEPVVPPHVVLYPCKFSPLVEVVQITSPKGMLAIWIGLIF